MKKILAKIVIFSVVSVLISMATSIQVFANPAVGTVVTPAPPADASAPAVSNNTTSPLGGATGAKEDPYSERKDFYNKEINKIIGNPCIKDDEIKKGLIITYLYEPLDIEDDKIQSTEVRSCYKHTLIYKDNLITGNEVIVGDEASATKCSESGLKEIGQNKQDKDLNTKYYCYEIQAIISKGGTAPLYAYIGMIYRWGASLVGIIAVAIIVFSGIQLAAAGGEGEAIQDAKKRILQSLAGIAILFLSGLILYTVNPNFFVK